MTYTKLIRTTVILLTFTSVISIAAMIAYASVAPEDVCETECEPQTAEEEPQTSQNMLLRKSGDGNTVIPLAAIEAQTEPTIICDLIGRRILISNALFMEGAVITTDFDYCSEIVASVHDGQQVLELHLSGDYECRIEKSNEALKITYCQFGELEGKKVILHPEYNDETQDLPLLVAMKTAELLAKDDILVYVSRIDVNLPQTDEVVRLSNEVGAQLLVELSCDEAVNAEVNYNEFYFRRHFDNARLAYIIKQSVAGRLKSEVLLSADTADSLLLQEVSIPAAMLKIPLVPSDELMSGEGTSDSLVQPISASLADAIRYAYAELMPNDE